MEYNELQQQIQALEASNSELQDQLNTISKRNVFHFFDDIGIGVVLLDRTGFVLRYNEIFPSLFGQHTIVVPQKTNLLDLVEMQDRQMITSVLSSFFDSNKQQYVFYTDTPDDENCFLRFHFSNPEQLQDYRFDVMVLCEKVYGGNTKPSEKLKEMSLLQEFIHSDSIGFWTLTLNSKRLKIDPDLCSLLGLKVDELTWNLFLSLFHKNDQEEIIHFTNNTKEEKILFYHTLRDRFNNNVIKHQLRLIRNEKGEPQFVIGFLSNTLTTTLDSIKEKVTRSEVTVAPGEWHLNSESLRFILPRTLVNKLGFEHTSVTLKNLLSCLVPASRREAIDALRDSIFSPNNNKEFRLVLKAGHHRYKKYEVRWIVNERNILNPVKIGSYSAVRNYPRRSKTKESTINSEHFTVDLIKKRIQLPHSVCKRLNLCNLQQTNLLLLLKQCFIPDCKLIKAFYIRAKKTSKPWSQFIRIYGKEGEMLTFEIEVGFTKNRKFSELYGTIRNTTALSQQQELILQLSFNEAIHSETQTVGSWLFYPETQQFYWSSNITELFNMDVNTVPTTLYDFKKWILIEKQFDKFKNSLTQNDEINENIVLENRKQTKFSLHLRGVASTNKRSSDRKIAGVVRKSVLKSSTSKNELDASKVNQIEEVAKIGSAILDLNNFELSLSKGFSELLRIDKNTISFDEFISCFSQEQKQKIDLIIQETIDYKTFSSIEVVGKIPRSEENLNIELTIQPSCFQMEDCNNLVLEIKGNHKSRLAQTSPAPYDTELEQLFGTFENAVTLVSLKGEFLYCNDSFLKQTGNETQFYTNIFQTNFADNALLKKKLDETKCEGKASFQYTVKSASGSNNHLEANSVYIPNFKSEESILIITHDVSQYISLQEEFASIKEKLNQNDKSKISFFANISHEIRTPMNAIIGFADLLNDEDLSKEERWEFTNQITDKSYQLLNLVTKVIDFSKLEGGEWKPKIESVHLDEVLTETKIILQKAIADFNRQNLLCSVRCNLLQTDRCVLLDKINFISGIRPILENAVKYTESGRVDVRCKLTPKNELLFTISDTGVGIEDDKLNMVFNLFSEGEDYYTRQFRGTGLGLSLSKKIIEKLEGRIWVESKKNIGSSFYIALPYIKAKSLNTTSHKKSQEVTPKDFNWSDKQILIVDDTAFILEILSRLLEPTEALVVGASSVKEAVVELQKERQFDVILLDIEMPTGSGLELLKLSKEKWPQIPIIVQTAYVESRQIIEYTELGAKDCIAKPIETNKLLLKLQQVFD